MVFRPARLWTVGAGVLLATLGMASPAVAGAHGSGVPAGNVGDSYAAGEGGTEFGSYLDVSDPITAGCHRSNTSAFELLARIHVVQPAADVACGGATTVNITTTGQYGEPPQASQLTADLRLVYVMIGGNDIGFGRVAGCFIQLDCDQTPVPAATLQLIQQLGPRLDAAYAAIRAGAPNARVVVTLYPSQLPGPQRRSQPLPGDQPRRGAARQPNPRRAQPDDQRPRPSTRLRCRRSPARVRRA